MSGKKSDRLSQVLMGLGSNSRTVTDFKVAIENDRY